MDEEKNILKKLLLEILHENKSKKQDKNKKIKISSSSSSSEEEVKKIPYKKIHETEKRREINLATGKSSNQNWRTLFNKNKETNNNNKQNNKKNYSSDTFGKSSQNTKDLKLVSVFQSDSKKYTSKSNNLINSNNNKDNSKISNNNLNTNNNDNNDNDNKDNKNLSHSINSNIKLDKVEEEEESSSIYFIDDKKYLISKEEKEKILKVDMNISNEITLENDTSEVKENEDKEFYRTLVSLWNGTSSNNNNNNNNNGNDKENYIKSDRIASTIKIHKEAKYICRICEIRGYSYISLLILHYKRYHKIMNIERLIEDEKFFSIINNDWWIDNKLGFDTNQTIELYKFKNLKKYLNTPVNLLPFPAVNFKELSQSYGEIGKEITTIINKELDLKRFLLPNQLKQSMKLNRINDSQLKNAGKDFKSHILKFFHFIIILQEEINLQKDLNNIKKDISTNNNNKTNKTNKKEKKKKTEIPLLCIEQFFDEDRIKFYILFLFERNYQINSIYNSVREIQRFILLCSSLAIEKYRFPQSKILSIKLLLSSTLNALSKAKQQSQRTNKVNEKIVNNNTTINENDLKILFSSVLEQLLVIKTLLEENHLFSTKNKYNLENNEDNEDIIIENTDNDYNIKQIPSFPSIQSTTISCENPTHLTTDFDMKEFYGDDDDDFIEIDNTIVGKKINSDKLIQKNQISNKKLEDFSFIGKNHIYFLHPSQYYINKNENIIDNNNKINQRFIYPLNTEDEFLLLSSYQNYLITLTLLLMLGQRPAFILNSTLNNTKVKEGRLVFEPRFEKTLRSEFHPNVSSSPYLSERDYFSLWVQKFRKEFIQISLKIYPHLRSSNFLIKNLNVNNNNNNNKDKIKHLMNINCNNKNNNTDNNMNSLQSLTIYDTVIQIWVNHAGNPMNPKQFRSSFRKVMTSVFPEKSRITPMSLRHLIPTFFANSKLNAKTSITNDEYEIIEKNLSIHLNTSVSILRLYYSDVNHSEELHSTIDMLSESFLLDEKGKSLLANSLNNKNEDSTDNISSSIIHPQNPTIISNDILENITKKDKKRNRKEEKISPKLSFIKEINPSSSPSNSYSPSISSNNIIIDELIISGLENNTENKVVPLEECEPDWEEFYD